MERPTMEIYVNGASYDEALPFTAPTAFWKKRSMAGSSTNLSVSSSGESENSYSKISIADGSDVDKEAPVAARKLLEAMAIRARYAALNPRQLKWMFDGTSAFATDNLPSSSEHTYTIKSGVYEWRLGENGALHPIAILTA